MSDTASCPSPSNSASAWPKGAVILLVLLSAALGLPAINNWLGFIMQRSPTDNALQILALLLLLIALPRYLRDTRPCYQPSVLAFGLLTLNGLAYLAAIFLSIKTILWGSFLLFPWLLYCALCGFKAGCRWLSFLLFAFFLLPDFPADINNAISLPLQNFSTRITTVLAGLFIPITAQGNIFHIRGNAFEVTSACSGLHTWIGFLFAGLLWQLLEGFSCRTLRTITLSAPLLALGTNSIRLWITALTAYWISPDTAVAVHTDLEYLLFPLGLLLLWRFLVSAGQADKPC